MKPASNCNSFLVNAQNVDYLLNCYFAKFFLWCCSSNSAPYCTMERANHICFYLLQCVFVSLTSPYQGPLLKDQLQPTLVAVWGQLPLVVLRKKEARGHFHPQAEYRIHPTILLSVSKTGSEAGPWKDMDTKIQLSLKKYYLATIN